MAQVQIKACKCEVCGNIWIPKKKGLPIRCGSCKSPYWNQKSTEVTRKSA